MHASPMIVRMNVVCVVVCIFFTFIFSSTRSLVCLRCALPYGDPKIEKLKSKEGVQKIPSLVVYREDGSLVQSFGNAQFCRHDVTEVGLHSMGGVSLVLDAWQQVSASSHVHFPDSWFQGIKPVVPAQVTLSFDMDDDF